MERRVRNRGISLSRGKAGPIEIELQHSHLPRLDDDDFINWDKTTDQITRGENFEEIQPLLKLMADHQEELPDDWS